MFIGRKKELDTLNNKYLSNRKEFGVIYGRRRIGKTFLIDEFVKDKENLFFQAKRDSIYGNLKSFSYAISKLIGLPKNFVFYSFEEAFDAIIDFASDRRFVIAIDEYPYIVKQDSSFSSVLQSVIDKAGDNLFFLLSGSDVSMMKDEIENHSSPLYKRRTFEMCVRKLSFSDSLEYLKDLSNEDKVNYLAITSTYPYYLSAMNFNISFQDNLKNLLFNEYGIFFNLPDQLLSNSTNVQDIYNAILKAVTKRNRTVKEIAKYVHEEDAKVSKYIATLLNSELLEKRETYMGNKKTHYYEISDPLLRFWYTFIFDNSELIKKNGNMVYQNVQEEIEQFICHGFEDIALSYMNELNNNGLLQDVYPEFKRYKVDKSQLQRSIEIDGLSNNEKNLIVIECKYRNIKFSKEMFEHLKESASIFPDKYNRIYYLFSKSGFADNMLEIEDSNVHLITIEDIFS